MHGARQECGKAVYAIAVDVLVAGKAAEPGEVFCREHLAALECPHKVGYSKGSDIQLFMPEVQVRQHEDSGVCRVLPRGRTAATAIS